MPRDAYSRASVLVKPITPALAATYGACPAEPISAVIEVMLMMRPASRAFINERNAARVQ